MRAPLCAAGGSNSCDVVYRLCALGIRRHVQFESAGDHAGWLVEVSIPDDPELWRLPVGVALSRLPDPDVRVQPPSLDDEIRIGGVARRICPLRAGTPATLSNHYSADRPNSIFQ